MVSYAKECLLHFLTVAKRLGRRRVYCEVLKRLNMQEYSEVLERGENCFDPGWGLGSTGRFEYGDLRVDDLKDRIVIVEAENACTRTLANLVKYWPLVRMPSQTRPILLLHVFRDTRTQPEREENAPRDTSHLKLWEFTWQEMKKELWTQAAPKLFARPFTYRHHNDYGEREKALKEALNFFHRCLDNELASVCKEFATEDTERSGWLNDLVRESIQAD
jgi:hypothetical protein